MSAEPAQINGLPAVIVRLNGELDCVMAIQTDDGLAAGLHYVRNPDKLSRLERETTITR